ncbi:LysM peptidoglycan-binding domain-containing M23 family metallopeptidase [Meiothermus taiwanensis]|uniref:Murein DD-endopeptidase MepM n=2 Tax=Meiothermus taiwanensis TaxID=172827 RepID=A0A399E4J6_9DEIN|nr:peptidase M23 [Meiothermus taiwanensis WR-220]KZK14750.1 peptidase M23 [Meiothermus taiwanensis]RIH79385.1 Murein DD-endopeptidase MepM [Meiothermus taiwanensis]
MAISELLSSVLATGIFSLPLGLTQPNLPGTEIKVGAPARKGWVIYTVRPGDTLSQIASRYRVDARAIMYSSGLQSAVLRPGQELRIPLVEEINNETRLPPGVRAYIVRNGDTVQSIARRFDLTILGLVSANPGLQSLDRLDVGSTLYIPTGEPGLLLQLKKGETIHDLAQRFGLSVTEVAKANGLDSPTDVRAGDMVLLPRVQARATYQRLLQIQEAERRAREEEARRLAEQRRKQEEARQKQLAEQRRLQAQSRARLQQQTQSQPRLRPANAVVAAAGYRWPISNFTITTYFGRRGVFQRFHTGIDLAAPAGTPVYAARAGQIDTAGWSRYGYGLHVIINHGGAQETLYAHMSRIVVRPGQWVDRGDLIGYVGSTGWSTGPHLHFEVRVGGAARNPLAYLP